MYLKIRGVILFFYKKNNGKYLQMLFCGVYYIYSSQKESFMTTKFYRFYNYKS